MLEISDLDQTPALQDIIKSVEHRATYALLEYEYIDIDFRDEYRNYYASTYRPLTNRCRRLHFFGAAPDAYRYLGFCVLRPISSRPVGRTVIAPPDDVARYVTCRAETTVRPYGELLRVAGFPFMEQDSQFAVCAHAAVWMVALYHHLAHHTPRRLLSDISKGALTRPEMYRITPSQGLSAEQVGTALHQLGLPPVPYAVRRLPSGQEFHEIVCRYLNSSLPVILTTHQHVTVLIGYGRDTSGRLFFIRSNDGGGPYQRIYASDDPLGPWHLLLVAMPGRIYLSGETAEDEANRVLGALLDGGDDIALRRRITKRGRLRLRSYVIQGGAYKIRMHQRGVPQDVIDTHRIVGTSNWIWIVELQDPDLARTTTRCVVGEIAFDATSDPVNPGPLFGNLPKRAFIWFDPRERPTEVEIGSYEPYLSGTAGHDAPSAKPAPRKPAARIRSRLRGSMAKSNLK